MAFFPLPNPDSIFLFGLKSVCAVDYSTVRAAGLRLIWLVWTGYVLDVIITLVGMLGLLYANCVLEWAGVS